METKNFGLVLSEARKLLNNGLYQSTEVFLSLYLSAISSSINDNEANKLRAVDEFNHLTVNAQIYELMGDSLLPRKEINRALHYFKLAIQNHRMLSSSKIKSSSGTSFWVSNSDQVSLCYKACNCQRDLRNIPEAIQELQAIPPELRDLRTLLLFGKLHKENDRHMDALPYYKQAFLLAPFSIEIIEELVTLNVKAEEMGKWLQGWKEKGVETSTLLQQPSQWLEMLILALIQKRSCESDKSIFTLQKLHSGFPKNAYLMTVSAESFAASEQPENALSLFRVTRRMDSFIVNKMDRMASILHSQAAEVELNRLSNELLENNPSQPEGWIAASWYCALRKDKDSIGFLNKALLLDPTNAEAHRAKGRQHFLAGNLDLALEAYIISNKIDKDLSSFVGIIETNFSLGRFKDGANWAKEMIMMFPKSAQAFNIMGKVLAKSPQGAAESIKAYTKALKFQPRLKSAALSLCNALLTTNKPSEAIECARQTLSRVNCPHLRFALASGLSMQGRQHEALEQLNLCIGMQGGSASQEVTREIERIESILRAENGLEDQDEDQLEGEMEDHGDISEY